MGFVLFYFLFVFSRRIDVKVGPIDTRTRMLVVMVSGGFGLYFYCWRKCDDAPNFNCAMSRHYSNIFFGLCFPKVSVGDEGQGRT